MIHKYLTIEKIRFEERLDFTIETDKQALEKEIPFFITQPLVENSIKHGLFNNPDGIKLKFRVMYIPNRLTLEVSNTGRLSHEWHMGVGLTNVLERLENCFPGRFDFSLRESEDLVIAKISIVLKNEKIHFADH